MQRLFILAAVFAAFVSTVSGQGAPPDTAAKAREAMEKLSWALGEWKGTGAVQMGPGARETSQVHEMLTSELGGTVMLIKGRGTRMVDGKEHVVHNALAVISYNPMKEAYEMKSWLASGLSTDAWIKLEGKGFDWGFDTARGKIRYRMRINDKGQWTEKGEFSADGQQWMEFFDMTLDRVKN